MSGWPLLDVLYLVLPAAVANMAPVLVRKLRFLDGLDKPIDAGLLWRNKPLLGKHKTWRGLLAGIVAGIIITGIQLLIGPTRFDLVDYHRTWLLLGFLLGAGALVGDAVKSFLKRRVGVPEGSPWVPYDQVDFGIGAIMFAMPVVQVGWPMSVAAVAILAAGHILAVRIGYMAGLRKEKW